MTDFNAGIFPILITNRYASLYDDEIQMALGFLVLMKRLLHGRNSINHFVNIYMPAFTFIGYVRTRSARNLKLQPQGQTMKHLNRNLVAVLAHYCQPYWQSDIVGGNEQRIYSEGNEQVVHEANFYYACARDYQRSIEACDKILHQDPAPTSIHSLTDSHAGFSNGISIISIRSNCSNLYDREIQMSLGLLMLLKFALYGLNDCGITVHLSRQVFIRYIRLRCLQYLNNSSVRGDLELNSKHIKGLLSVFAHFYRANEGNFNTENLNIGSIRTNDG